MTSTVADAESEDDDDDLLGGGGGNGGQTNTAGTNGTSALDLDDMGDFENSFSAVDTANEAVAPGGTITGSSIPYRSTYDTNGSANETEPEVLREWREKRDAAIAQRDSRSAAKKAETVKAAQGAIDDFYENYNNRKEKQVAQTRKEAEEFLAGREDTTSGGTSWERIAKLIDLSGKGAAGGGAGTSKGRMREVLVSLRKDEDAPGAKGI